MSEYGENATQQVVAELFARLDALEKRVAALEPPEGPCKHDSLGRCVVDSWEPSRAVEFSQAFNAWVCRKCNSPAVTHWQAAAADVTAAPKEGK